MLVLPRETGVVRVAAIWCFSVVRLEQGMKKGEFHGRKREEDEIKSVATRTAAASR